MCLEVIVEQDETFGALIVPDKVYKINERYAVWYYEEGRLPPISIRLYTYGAIPKCYGFCSEEALEVSGILNLRRQENLELTGEGVYVGIVDSGINIWDKSFRNEDGTTRIAALWDQEEDIVYDEASINSILLEEEGKSFDEDGHGTFLASVIAGGVDLEKDFTGAAPNAKLIVVKLKEADKELRDFYFIPVSKIVYSEADIMRGVSFIENLMETDFFGFPLVLCLGLGCNNGNHCGTLPLAQYLDSIALLRNRAVVTPMGNEGISQHHYRGNIASDSDAGIIPREIEINVDNDVNGFYVECWALAPERIMLQVKSPLGEIRPSSANLDTLSQSFSFPLENARITIDYKYVARRSRDQLAFLRFENVPKGIWTILVSPANSISGRFDLWLPADGMLERNVFFLAPNPNSTITSPGDSILSISVGGYSLNTGGIYLNTGRGFLPNNDVKPDFIAPCDEIVGKGLRDNFVTYTGTSAAAAITAGASALFMEWAAVKQNYPDVNSIDVKNFLIRGATRLKGQEYPSEQAGYGRMEIYQSFRQI